MGIVSLAAIILATYRISHLLVYEEGPFSFALKFREALGIKHDDDGEISQIPEKIFPKLFSCLPCLSIWAGALIYLIWEIEPIPVWILAASGGAMLLKRY